MPIQFMQFKNSKSPRVNFSTLDLLEWSRDLLVEPFATATDCAVVMATNKTVQ